MNLTNEEKETVIRFDEAGLMAVVYTNNSTWKNKLAKLASERPAEVCFMEEDGWGGVTYEVPKKWLRLQAPIVLSEEQRAAKAKLLADNLSTV